MFCLMGTFIFYIVKTIKSFIYNSFYGVLISFLILSISSF